MELLLVSNTKNKRIDLSDLSKSTGKTKYLFHLKTVNISDEYTKLYKIKIDSLDSNEWTIYVVTGEPCEEFILVPVFSNSQYVIMNVISGRCKKNIKREKVNMKYSSTYIF